MIPKLYQPTNATGTQRTFLGYLNNCSKCAAKENTSSNEYTLELTTDLKDFCKGVSTQKLIEVKANPFDVPQLFVINKIERLISGKVNVYAEHIKTLCNQYVTDGASVYSDEDINILSNVTPAAAWNSIINDYTPAAAQPPFIFTSDITTTHNFSLGLTKAETFGNILGGVEGSFLDVWRGEYHFNNYTIEFLRSRGSNTGYRLRYGSNISDATQTEDTSRIYTHILPYGTFKDAATDKEIVLVGNLTAISNTESVFKKTFLLDCSTKTKNLKVYSQSTATHAAGDGYTAARTVMTNYANRYASANKLGLLTVGIKVTYRSELDSMSTIGLGDTVIVLLDNFGTATTAKVTEAEYDCLLERWNSLTVGEPQTTLAELLLNKKRYL